MMNQIDEPRRKQLVETYGPIAGEYYDEGREKGREEGREEVMLSVMQNLFYKGFETKQIAEIFGISYEKAEEILKKIKDLNS